MTYLVGRRGRKSPRPMLTTLSLHRAARILTLSLAAAAATGCVKNDPADTDEPDASGSSSGSMPDPDASGSDSGAFESDATIGDDASADDAADDAPLAAITDSSCAANNWDQTKFVNLAPPMLSALDRTESDPLLTDAGVTTPAGWNFYQIPGAICRDGSPNGIFVRYSSDPANSNKLMINFEGGGACISPHFCDHNPANLNEMFSGGADGQGEGFGAVLSDNLVSPPVAQLPWDKGIFDFTNDANPFKGWNQVYIPYCTGDVHFGTNDNGTVATSVIPGGHFVGYNNAKLFIGHLVPTFPNLQRVVLTGSSAGGLGAVLNAGMVQDAFTTKVPITVLDDSAVGFPDPMYMPACLQKEFRDTWGFNAALPSDCASCFQPDGSGLMNLINYWHAKYRKAKIGLVMSIHDQIFRLFFASGANDCFTNDPNLLTTLGLQGGDVPGYPGSLWEQGLDSLRTAYGCTGAFSTYYIGTAVPDAGDMNGTIDTLHMHIFRDRFYQTLAGNKSIAQFAQDLLDGQVEDIGP
jgi:Pectinacetylesterase